jgi:CMP-N,N'-diacetyllegionaminic acid synthase
MSALLICTIGARAGSKGVRNKNLRPLCGEPLVVHTARQARQSGLFDVIAVSSDSAEIRAAAMAAGATDEVVRPPELATDEVDKAPATVHCVSTIEARRGRRFDVVVDLDATAPLREARHIRAAVELLQAARADNVITGVASRRSPYFNLVERQADGTVRLSKPPAKAVYRRQDVPQAFAMNASIYVWTREAFFRDQAAVFGDRTVLYEMPEWTGFDVDTELDWVIVEFLMQNRGRA